MLCAVLGLASAGYAREPKAYQMGKLVQMESIACGTTEKGSVGVAGEVLGTDSSSKKTEQLLCQEYVMESEHVTYRIRPRDEKHPALLPVGELAQFRLQKDKMLLRLENPESKERAYIVVSMTPRSEASTADATPSRLNHLQ
jgi:hypothetical protein